MSSHSEIIQKFYRKYYNPALEQQQLSASQFAQRIIEGETNMLKQMDGAFWEPDPTKSMLWNIVYLCLESEYTLDHMLWHSVWTLVDELRQDDPASLQQILSPVIDFLRHQKYTCLNPADEVSESSMNARVRELETFLTAVLEETLKKITQNLSDSPELNPIAEELTESKAEELLTQPKYQAGWWAREAEDKKTWEDYKQLQMTLGRPLAKL